MSWSASWPAAMQARSAPCRAGSLHLAFLASVVLLLAAPAQADFWIQADPAGAPEEALRAAAAQRDAEARVPALERVARDNAGSGSSGLAWLAVALDHLDAGRFAEAEAALRQPDVKRTALADRAQLTLARAYEGGKRDAEAARTYTAILEEYPQTPMLCDVLSRAADAWSRTSERDRSRPLLERLLNECPGWEPSALLRLGQYAEARGRLREAADYYDRLDCDYPGSPRSVDAARRLVALKGKVAPLPPAVRFQRDLRKAVALSDDGRHKEAAPLLRSLLARTPPTAADGEIVRMRLARALIALDKDTEAQRLLQVIPDTSVYGAEAAFLRARAEVERTRRPYPYEAVAASFKGTEWAEEALLSLANFYLKDARIGAAAPYFQRLLAEFPDGRYLERASWWAGWWEYLSGRMEPAAAIFENLGRKRPDSLTTAGALYWAGRAYQRLGDGDKSREMFKETVKRFKYTYHGQRAADALGLLREGASSTHPAETTRSDGHSDVPEPYRTRVRQLLLIGRLDEARDELERVPSSVQAQATVAWIDWKKGRLRPAITTMRRAYPDWRSQAVGDSFPYAVWRILYPLDYEKSLVTGAGEEGLDSALMAALIWQESAFDSQARSAVGARGLMQLMPSTGRSLARRLGMPRLKPEDLDSPAANLKLGALYLKDMINRFGGRVERALAAYNAGPTRVVRWTAGERVISAEEFIESIPFAETRTYVMNILSHREQYRRLYSLPDKPEAAMVAAAAAAPAAPDAARQATAVAKAAAPTRKAATVKRSTGTRQGSSVRKKAAPARKAPAKKKKAAPRRRTRTR
jgi:soluble lytic murein transglycosylase